MLSPSKLLFGTPDPAEKWPDFWGSDAEKTDVPAEQSLEASLNESEEERRAAAADPAEFPDPPPGLTLGDRPFDPEADSVEEDADDERYSDLPSIGSANHFNGTCDRCCFHPKGRCLNGYNCLHCHFDHEKRKRKNKKKSKAKATEEIEGPPEPFSVSGTPEEYGNPQFGFPCAATGPAPFPNSGEVRYEESDRDEYVRQLVVENRYLRSLLVQYMGPNPMLPAAQPYGSCTVPWLMPPVPTPGLAPPISVPVAPQLSASAAPFWPHGGAVNSPERPERNRGCAPAPRRDIL